MSSIVRYKKRGARLFSGGLAVCVFVMLCALTLTFHGCVQIDQWDRLSKGKEGFAVPNGIFVSILTGSDVTGDGSKDNPYATIQMGITQANIAGETRVNVARGTYNVDGDLNPVVLIEGISLYGGYNEITWYRDASLYVTIIIDIAVSGGAGGLNPIRCIEAGAGISNATLVDGFTINGGSGVLNSSAIRCLNGGSPFIYNCILNGGSGSNRSYGILAYNGSSPSIRGCTINGGNSATTSIGIHCQLNCNAVIAFCMINGGNPPAGGTSTYGIFNLNNSKGSIYGNSIYGGIGAAMSYGIYCEMNSNPDIYNNIINAGSSLNSTCGVYFTGSSGASVCNNIIIGGDGPVNARGITLQANSNNTNFGNNIIQAGNTGAGNVCCVFLDNSISSNYVNNIFYTVDGALRYGIYESNGTCQPVDFLNNNFFDCPDGNYFDLETFSSYWTSIELDTEVNTGASNANGNITVSLVLDGDFRVVSPPASITDGGFDLSVWLPAFPATAGFPIDRAGVVRSVPWSIGPYEY